MPKISFSSLAGFLLGFAFIILSLGIGHRGFAIYNVMLFIDFESLLFVFGIVIPFGIFIHGIAFLKFLLSCLSAFIFNVEADGKKAQIASDCIIYSAGGGAFGALVGLVKMLATLDDPSKIGAGIAVALLTPLYALIVCLLFLAIAKKFSAQELQAPKADLKKPLLGCISGIILFGLIVLGFIAFTLLETKEQNTQPNMVTGIEVTELPEGKVLIKLNDIQSNLKSDGKTMRYVKLTMVLELRSIYSPQRKPSNVKSDINELGSRIKAAVLMEALATDQNTASSNEGRMDLEKRLLEKIRTLLPPQLQLDAIYITNYLVS